MDLKKYLTSGIVSFLFLGLSWAVSTLWNDTKKNTYFSIQQSKETELLKKRLETIEEKQSNMDEIFVTRRELSIMLNSIDSKVESVNSEVKSLNVKFDKLMEKMYEKK